MCPNIIACLLQGLGLGGSSVSTAATTAAVTPAAVPVGTPYIRGVRLGFVGDVNRVAGANRYATAAAIADAEHTDGDGDPTAIPTVVIARGDNFPDALAASYLAGQNDAPILLTTPSSLPAETALVLKEHAVTDVILVGGPSAINTSVENAIKAAHTWDLGADTANDETFAVRRIGGADRYATAALVAEDPGADAAGTIGIADGDTCDNDVKQAIVASGENFPDALAAGGLAYGGVGPDGCGEGPIPLLLTPKDSLSPAAAIAIRDLGIEHVILVGGPAAVSDSVKSALDGLQGVSVNRFGGANRQETAVMLASFILGPDIVGAWNSGTFLVARPDTFPDALAASSLSGSGLAPLYLAASTTDLGAVAQNGILDYPQPFGHGILIGGTSALSAGVETQVAKTIASQ
jgi:putative cell wall-binding protein